MNHGAVAGSLLLLLVALSGCTSDPAPPEEETGRMPGTVDGRVLDEIGLPVPGANVTILLTQHIATTDAAGAFSIPDVRPGPVALTATKNGYSTQTVRGALGDDGRLSVEFQLKAAPRLEPRHVTTTEEGLIACGLPLGTGCGPGSTDPDTEYRFAVAAGLTGIVAELEWAAPAPDVAPGLRLELAAATEEACGETYASASGESVLRFSVAQGFPVAGGHQCVTIWPTEDVVLQQDYALHVTFFYHMALPDGFSALE